MGFRSFPFSPYSPLDTLFHQGFDPSGSASLLALAALPSQRRGTAAHLPSTAITASDCLYDPPPSSLALTPSSKGRAVELTAYSSPSKGSKLSDRLQGYPRANLLQTELKGAKTKRKTSRERSLGRLTRGKRLLTS